MKREGFSGIFFHEGLLALIIIYFSFHGYVVHFGSVPATSLLVLSVVIFLFSLIIQRILLKLFENRARATVYSAILLLAILFFGVWQDIVSGLKPIANMGRLTIFFPLCLLVLIVSFLIISRSKATFRRFRIFLATLMLIYLVVDVFNLARQAGPENHGKQVNLKEISIPVSGNKSRPPVYILLLDEYQGNEGLDRYYNYPNASLRKKLLDGGFHINRNPSSNYHLTVYSLASMLNMEYLEFANPAVISNHFAYKRALQAIDKNKTAELFRRLGYHVKNKSPFYFDGQAPGFSTGLLPDKLNLAQHQTMYYRVARALPDILAEKFGIRYFAERNAELADKSNHRMMTEVLDESKVNNRSSFTYLHLMMPHEPFVRDSLGNKPGLMNYGGSRTIAETDSAYLQYLVYTNNVIMEFIEKLKASAGGCMRWKKLKVRCL
ncbi:MAG: hypothetical protein EOO04_34840, partial [Chitinophagaceae bacterium]